MSKSLRLLLILLSLFVASGARCVGWKPVYPFGPQTPQAPRVMPEYPTLAQVIEIVNSSTARVHSLSSTSVRVTSPGMPTLSANLAIQRPRRFRLRAETALTGPEVDIGSNDEIFWLWVRRSEPPVMYVCRHDRFAQSAARQTVPIDPEWLIEAIGLVSFDPAGRHFGPQPLRDGRLEIRSILPGPLGDMTRVTHVDGRGGFILEQHLYNTQGTLLASAVASRHIYDPVYGVSLPRRLDIQMPSGQINLRLELGDLRVNQVVGDPQQIWAKPTYDGCAEVDLGGGLAPPSRMPPSRMPPSRIPLSRIP